jgi:phosphoribosylanthranilate isomerase
MSTLVKICGITNIADALDAVELGADYLGFNFYQDSPRYISPDDCKVLLSDIPFSIGKVGVFVNADPQYVIDVSTGLNLDLLQFHGDETAVYCEQFARPVMKAIRPKNESDVTALKDFNTDFVLVDAFVQDSYGGTGVVSNWDLAKEAKQYGKLFLSGGLKPDNVELAIGSVKPFAVDVCSGIEKSPGNKQYHLMSEFIQRVKNVKQS